MEKKSKHSHNLDIGQIVKGILETIERPREREIISKRFGLFARKRNS